MRYIVRNAKIDELRGFAITLVVLGHCIQYGSGYDYLLSESYWDNWIFRVIYSFHMPLFALVSGYLIYGQLQRQLSFLRYIVKQLKSLVLPIFCWTLLSFLATSVLGRPIGVQLLTNFLGRFFTNLWFLWAVFYASIFLAIVHYLFKDNYIPVIIALPLLLLIPNDWNLSVYVWTAPFFFIGYFWNIMKKNLDTLINVNAGLCFWGGVLVIFVTIFCLLFLFSRITGSPYTNGMQVNVLSDKATVQLINSLYYWIIGIVGCLPLLIFTFRIIDRGVIAFQKLGITTLGIYAFSSLLNDSIVYLTSNFSSHLYVNLLEMLIVLGVSYFVTMVIKKVDILSFLLLGRR